MSVEKMHLNCAFYPDFNYDNLVISKEFHMVQLVLLRLHFLKSKVEYSHFKNDPIGTIDIFFF